MGIAATVSRALKLAAGTSRCASVDSTDMAMAAVASRALHPLPGLVSRDLAGELKIAIALFASK
jgi:hypothetical protein